MQITPFLWFDDDAEEAIAFYRTVFADVEVRDVQRYPGDGPGPADRLMTATMTLLGRDFMLLNGGPHYTLTEAYSMFVSCQDQAEVDRLWDALTADGGEPGRCGWLKDRFGLSWQIIPTALGELAGADPARSGAVIQAMLAMTKIDIAGLQAAYDHG